MATATIHKNGNTQAAIFARLWDARETGLSPRLARHVLKLRFSDEDEARMHELATQNQQRKLSAQEEIELDDLVAILQSKARKLLKKSKVARPHG